MERLIGFDSELIRDPQLGLTGDLTTFAPSASYLMQTNGTVDNAWNGHAYKPETTAVTLKRVGTGLAICQSTKTLWRNR